MLHLIVILCKTTKESWIMMWMISITPYLLDFVCFFFTFL
uniref:Uncharacterized protein n=1 Tax=Rhizophora mucronata TaxID=61149 RepID=A0A2P2P1Z9_RHIMU